MVRPRIDPKVRRSRLEGARKEARKLARRLPEKVYCEVSEWGRIYTYFKADRTAKKVRIRSEFGTPEFDLELAAAKRGQPLLSEPTRQHEVRALKSAAVATCGWLLEEYIRRDTKWPTYTDRSRRERGLRAAFNELINPQSALRFRDMPLEHFGVQSVLTLVERKLKCRKVPHPVTGDTITVTTNRDAANQLRKWLGNIVKFGVKHGYLSHNFVRDVERQEPQSANGFPAWPHEALEAYRACHPPGTLARLVFDIALYTTARKADIPRLNFGMMRKDRKGRDTLVYVAHKLSNKKPIRVFQPVFPELQASLDAAKAAGILGEMLFIVQKKQLNRPERGFSPDTIANYMQNWIDAALAKAGLEHPRGPSGYSLHGLRKSGVCGLILRGIRDREIMAITGHRDPREIDLYGREYMRSLGAEAAFDQWQSHQQKCDFDESEFEAEFA